VDQKLRVRVRDIGRRNGPAECYVGTGAHSISPVPTTYVLTHATRRASCVIDGSKTRVRKKNDVSRRASKEFFVFGFWTKILL
jgi:hypothetical protein